MTVPAEVFEPHVPTPAELAEIVKAERARNNWSQATLAELAGVTERTVQRVENGKPSSLDSRRALARAFGYTDVDAFEKPWPFPNVDKLKAYAAELEKTTVAVALTGIQDGRTLRTMVERAHASVTEELGEVSSAARQAFAEMVDYLRDYKDENDLYSMAQRLDVDRDIEKFLKTISDERAAVGAGLRSGRFRLRGEPPEREPMEMTHIYLVLASDSTLPSTVRVPKSFQFG